MSQKTAKGTKTTKQLRKIRNTVMMVLICVLLLSTATYAWFSVSSTAKVTNLTMTVGSEQGLQIAPDENKSGNGTPGTYSSELEFAADENDTTSTYYIAKPLLPATMLATDSSIQKPVYTDGDVTAVEAVESDEILKDGETEDGKYYYYTTTFYLKTTGESNVNVKLAESSLTETYKLQNDATEITGTYILNYLENTSDAATQVGAKALRIRLVSAADDTEIIYQPLSDFTPTGQLSMATDARGNATTAGVEPTNVQLQDGTFDSAKNDGYITVTPDGTRITMEIWLEGTDDCCADEIMAQDIIGQLSFEIDSATTTP